MTVTSSGPDTQAPTLTLTSPAAQTQNITGSPTFTVTTSDNVGVTAVDYQVDGDAAGTASSSPWSFRLPSASAYTTGVHVIRARARDAAGNQSAWSSARVSFGGNVDPAGGLYPHRRTSQCSRSRVLRWRGAPMGGSSSASREVRCGW